MGVLERMIDGVHEQHAEAVRHQQHARGQRHLGPLDVGTGCQVQRDHERRQRSGQQAHIHDEGEQAFDRLQAVRQMPPQHHDREPRHQAVGQREHAYVQQRQQPAAANHAHDIRGVTRDEDPGKRTPLRALPHHDADAGGEPQEGEVLRLQGQQRHACPREQEVQQRGRQQPSACGGPRIKRFRFHFMSVCIPSALPGRQSRQRLSALRSGLSGGRFLRKRGMGSE